MTQELAASPRFKARQYFVYAHYLAPASSAGASSRAPSTGGRQMIAALRRILWRIRYGRRQQRQYECRNQFWDRYTR